MDKHAPVAWIVAAENDWIPGGKVGGVGDVIRDLPPALVKQGWRVRVVVPSYGAFHRQPGAQKIGPVQGRFAGAPFEASAWQLSGSTAGVEQVVIDHPLLNPGPPGEVYHMDPPDQPFATDANKFAFFGAAVAAWLDALPAPPDVVHLHDWHTGMVPLLRQLAGGQGTLGRTRMVFTVHNLAYQGVRPMDGVPSSFESWFPGLASQAEAARDPADPTLVNFMACALRLADHISTVSPTYAAEILRPSDPASGFHGGEGLEGILQHVASEKRLVGILNGCEYPEDRALESGWDSLLEAIAAEPAVASRDAGLHERLERLRGNRRRHTLLNIGRIVPQKVALLLEPVPGFPTALDAVLEQLGDRGLFILLGSGSAHYEQQLHAISGRRENFLFLNGYAQALSDRLYGDTDLFVMPSSFEPCGISQLLALRAGQPCLVHGVGGLADTIEDGVTGFVFNGATPAQQAVALVDTVGRALHFRETDPEGWSGMRQAAAAQRFTWELAARRTVDELYMP